MEQKQLDELEDSFFGEEFIEDLEDLPPASSKSQEIKIEPREEPAELRLRKATKKASSPAVKKSAAKKSEKSAAVKPKETVSEQKPVLAEKVSETKEIKEAKSSHSIRDVTKGTEKKTPENTKRETATVTIKPAKESAKETKPVVETSSPVNPWEEDNKDSGLFKETSTWKALTGIALVLLVLSLFTQGFNFSDKNAVTGAATVSLQEAEQKVLQYVNTQLLQPPFQAEVQSSEELNTLYRVTLAVAGQEVDSYVTKDGKLFFPQGLNMDEDVLNREVKANEVSPKPKDLEMEVEAKVEKPVPSKPELAPKPEEPKEMEGSAVGDTVKLTLNAKKWVFQPNVLRVTKGSTVVLTVVPNGLDFTFVVPSLGVEQEVAGTTEVVFTADKAGTFDFTCSSCEEWRGMIGNLVVESAK